MPWSSQTVVLCEAVLQGGLITLVPVSLCTADLQGGLQSDLSLALQHRASRRALDCGVWCPVYKGAPEMLSSCVVYRGANKLVISFSVALCAVDLLGWLRI